MPKNQPAQQVEKLLSRIYPENTLAIAPDGRMFYINSETFVFYKRHVQTAPLLFKPNDLKTANLSKLHADVQALYKQKGAENLAHMLIFHTLKPFLGDKSFNNFHRIIYLLFGKMDATSQQKIKKLSKNLWQLKNSMYWDSPAFKQLRQMLSNKISERRNNVSKDLLEKTIKKARAKQKDISPLLQRIQPELDKRLHYISGFIDYFLQSNGMIVYYEQSTGIRDSIQTLYAAAGFDLQSCPRGLVDGDASVIFLSGSGLDSQLQLDSRQFSIPQTPVSSPTILGHQPMLAMQQATQSELSPIEVLMEELHDYFHSVQKASVRKTPIAKVQPGGTMPFDTAVENRMGQIMHAWLNTHQAMQALYRQLHGKAFFKKISSVSNKLLSLSENIINEKEVPPTKWHGLLSYFPAPSVRALFKEFPLSEDFSRRKTLTLTTRQGVKISYTVEGILRSANSQLVILQAPAIANMNDPQIIAFILQDCINEIQDIEKILNRHYSCQSDNTKYGNELSGKLFRILYKYGPVAEMVLGQEITGLFKQLNNNAQSASSAITPLPLDYSNAEYVEHLEAKPTDYAFCLTSPIFSVPTKLVIMPLQPREIIPTISVRVSNVIARSATNKQAVRRLKTGATKLYDSHAWAPSKFHPTTGHPIHTMNVYLKGRLVGSAVLYSGKEFCRTASNGHNVIELTGVLSHYQAELDATHFENECRFSPPSTQALLLESAKDSSTLGILRGIGNLSHYSMQRAGFSENASWITGQLTSYVGIGGLRFYQHFATALEYHQDPTQAISEAANNTAWDLAKMAGAQATFSMASSLIKKHTPQPFNSLSSVVSLGYYGVCALTDGSAAMFAVSVVSGAITQALVESAGKSIISRVTLFSSEASAATESSLDHRPVQPGFK